jgi:hypothetical protein
MFEELRIIGIAAIFSLAAAPALADNHQSMAQAMAQLDARKAAFDSTVDKSITAEKIIAYPSRYVGKRVNLHGRVTGVGGDVFSLDCALSHEYEAANVTVYGGMNHGAPNAIIGIKKGQEIRVRGVVEAHPAVDIAGNRSMSPYVRIGDISWDR